jgi:hypothetical protein
MVGRYVARKVVAPPLSFVKNYMIQQKITTRVNEKKWEEIKTAWGKLSDYNKQTFNNRPLLGLKLDRRLSAEQKSKLLHGQK